MGKEAVCNIRYEGRTSQGKALLESNELIFRGDFRLKIPLKQIQSAQAKNGELHIQSPECSAIFELGPQAAKWVEKIVHPPSLLDKLGVKPGTRVAVVGKFDDSLRRELNPGAIKEADLIFLSAEAREALERLSDLHKSLKSGGAIWVVYPKGQKHITEADVLSAGRRSGLADVKVASFSATHTALKFAIRRAC